MSPQLPRLPQDEILRAVGYKTAFGDWPEGFDVGLVVLQMINEIEACRMCLQAHHDERAENGLVEADELCPICVRAQIDLAPPPDAPPADWAEPTP
jgi:hypothetical protein